MYFLYLLSLNNSKPVFSIDDSCQTRDFLTHWWCSNHYAILLCQVAHSFNIVDTCRMECYIFYYFGTTVLTHLRLTVILLHSILVNVMLPQKPCHLQNEVFYFGTLFVPRYKHVFCLQSFCCIPFCQMAWPLHMNAFFLITTTVKFKSF